MDKNLLQDRSMFENVTTKSVAKYALLPGIVPMIRRLAERCGQFLFMFTMVFGAVGLIDKNHPCLRPENIGRYRFVDILGLATHNVVFDRKHIPQIVMFFATILTLVLTIAIVVASLAQLFVHTSTAYAQAYYGLETTQAKDDWSYQFLGRFFGNTGMDFWGGNSVDPRMSILQPMFRAMIQHYSIAIMVIAVFMIIYMAVTRLAESARTGEPFGKSFNNVWGPIRIVMCIGLLVPIGTGYNAAQLITFQVAEWGGALATNVWNAGLDNVRQSKFVVPNRPDYGFKFIRGVFLIRTCVGLWNRAEADDSGSKMYARPWISTESRTNSEMITIKFGPYMDKSFCGEIMFPRVRTIGSGAKPDKLVDIDTFAAKVETSYQHIVKTFLGDFTLDVAPPYGQRSGLNSAWSPGPYPWDVEDGSPVLITSSMHQDIDNAADQCIRTKNCKYDDFMPPGSVESWVRTYWTAIGYKDWGATPNATYNPTDDRFFNTPYFRDEVHTMNQKAIDILKSGQSHGWASAGAFYLRLTEMQNIITGS
ncbi:MAG TPA: DotA/TraY family protein, partial [Alphaproteobacteria bacterium]